MEKKGVIPDTLLIILLLIFIGTGGFFVLQNVNYVVNQITGLAGLPSAPDCIGLKDGCVDGSEPWMCVNEEAIEKCQSCGCPSGYECLDDGSCTNECDDGTPIGDCNEMTAGGVIEYCYYDAGSKAVELIQDCDDHCSCPSGYECIESYCILIDPGGECGDGTCDEGEDCNSCPIDCGQCSPSGNGDDGGGTSGGGGAPSTNDTEEEQEETETTYSIDQTQQESIVENVKANDIINIKLDQIEYPLNVNHISEFSVILDDQGEIIVVKAEQPKEIDLNDNDENDMEISFLEIDENNQASLKFGYLEEMSQEPTLSPPEQPKTNPLIYYFAGGLILLLVASILIKLAITKLTSKKHIKTKKK